MLIDDLAAELETIVKTIAGYKNCPTMARWVEGAEVALRRYEALKAWMERQGISVAHDVGHLSSSRHPFVKTQRP